MTAPRIFQQPHAFRHRQRLSAQPLSDYKAINEEASLFAATGAKIGNLTRDDHLIVPFHARALLPYWDVPCNVTLMMYEPRAIKPRHYFVLPFVCRKFKYILAHSPEIIKACPNAVFFNGHRCQTPPSDIEKTKLISLIASKKRDLYGHRLRHTIVDRCRDRMDLFGLAYKYVKSKTEALAEYMYSVTIENNRAEGYFTEKIMDCFINKTVPIYWGDPAIGNHFNMDGIIYCDNEDDIVRAVETVTAQDYATRREAIEDNFRRTHQYLSQEGNLLRTMTRLINGG